jgi:hypothetical protein
MSNKVDIFTNICKSLFSKKIPATSEEEPLSERLYLGMTHSMKAAIIERVMANRKPGATSHGAISNFIREAIVLHLERK